MVPQRLPSYMLRNAIEPEKQEVLVSPKIRTENKGKIRINECSHKMMMMILQFATGRLPSATAR